jgi:hypothetical protein
VPEPGWLADLGAEQRRALTTALAGLYKLAGVDLVREQLDAALPEPRAGYDLDGPELVLWTDRPHGLAVRYDLTRPDGRLLPRRGDGSPAEGWPELDPARVVFARVRLTWPQLAHGWEKDQDGQGHPALVTGGRELVLLPRTVAPAPTALQHIHTS